MPNMDKQFPTMNIEDQRLMVGPTTELEDDPLDDNHPIRDTWMEEATSPLESWKLEEVHFLQLCLHLLRMHFLFIHCL